MPLQDLTPHLRTRLNRIEKSVGWFLGLAVLALAASFLLYSYHTAKTKGWFKSKATYYTFVKTASGMKIGDPVKLMGLSVGEVTRIDPMPAEDTNANMYVEFRIWEPYYGYLWSDSRVRLGGGDFLGGRFLDVKRGLTGNPSYKLGKKLEPLEILTQTGYKKVDQNSKFELPMDESETLGDELTKMIDVVKGSLPNILALTNRIELVLNNSALLTSNINLSILRLDPTLAHLRLITEGLTNRQGSLGEWLIPTNLNQGIDNALIRADGVLLRVDQAVAKADGVVAQTGHDVHVAITNLYPALEHLAGITSNLNSQVQANSNMLAVISSAIQHADEVVQGLKKHWLLRSAFKEEKTNAPSRRPTPAKHPNSNARSR